MISIIIPSLTKNPKTLNSLQNLSFKNEIIISNKKGIGYARNYGATLAKGEILVFFDSTLIINKKIWKKFLSIKENSFIMGFEGFSHGGTPEPITQILCIRKKDFDKIKFSNKIIYSGEDRDFFIKAIKKGLKPILIKRKNNYKHIEHKTRALQNSYTLIKFTNEHAKLLVKHGAYIRVYKSFTRWFIPFVFKKSYTKVTIKSVIKKIFSTTLRNILFFFNLIKGVDI